VLCPPRCGQAATGRPSVARPALSSPGPPEAPARAGRGGSVTAPDVLACEARTLHLGERPRQGQERARREPDRAPASSEAPCRRLRGQSRQRGGKPRPGRRAPPCQVCAESPRCMSRLGQPCQGQRRTTSWHSFPGVAGCGESRRHGGHGGDGKTPFGWASCPYPLIHHSKAARSDSPAIQSSTRVWGRPSSK
jgi:hypothetical protein